LENTEEKSENIGKDTVYDPSDHPSLIEIKKQNDCTNKFVFEKRMA
jgi:hypothetical protein